jgi:hypothetical protein
MTEDIATTARTNLEKRRHFRAEIISAIGVDLLMVVIWAATGAGYFWPGWVIGASALGLAATGYHVYGRQPISQADIDREIARLQK